MHIIILLQDMGQKISMKPKQLQSHKSMVSSLRVPLTLTTGKLNDTSILYAMKYGLLMQVSCVCMQTFTFKNT